MSTEHEHSDEVLTMLRDGFVDMRPSAGEPLRASDLRRLRRRRVASGVAGVAVAALVPLGWVTLLDDTGNEQVDDLPPAGSSTLPTDPGVAQCSSEWYAMVDPEKAASFATVEDAARSRNVDADLEVLDVREDKLSGMTIVTVEDRWGRTGTYEMSASPEGRWFVTGGSGCAGY